MKKKKLQEDQWSLKVADQIIKKLRENQQDLFNNGNDKDVNGNTNNENDKRFPNSVEDRLLYYEEKKQKKLKEAIDKQMFETKQQANTSFVAPHSQGVNRPGDVSDRLYHLASAQQRDRSNLIELSNNQTHDELTGQRLFQVIFI